MTIRLPGDRYVLLRRDQMFGGGWFACRASGDDYFQARARGPLRALWKMLRSRRLNRYDDSSPVIEREL